MSVLTDLRAGAYTALTNTTLAQTHTARPATAESFPIGWVQDVRVDLLHDTGLRMWSGEVDVVLAVSGWDNEEEMAALDVAQQQLIDFASDTPHLMGANTVCEPVRARMSGVDFGDGVPRPAVTITLGRFVFQEGR